MNKCLGNGNLNRQFKTKSESNEVRTSGLISAKCHRHQIIFCQFRRQYDPSHRQVTTAYRHSLIGYHEIRLKHEILLQESINPRRRVITTLASAKERQSRLVPRVSLYPAPLRSAPLRPLATLRSAPPLQEPNLTNLILSFLSLQKILPPTTPLM